MAGKFIRGALIEFMPTFLIPLPNVIIFQFNPETMTHRWTQPEAAAGASAPGGNPLAVKGVPGEGFSFTLVMDTLDMIADGSPVAQGLAETTGIYTRLAALEMLQYPTGAFLRRRTGRFGIGGAGAAGRCHRRRRAAPLIAACRSRRCRRCCSCGGRAASCRCA